MTEAQISREIQRFMKALGFAVYSTEQGYRHERGGTRTSAGIPDLIVLGHGFCLFVEVKRPGGKLRPSQAAFRDEVNDLKYTGDIDWGMWTDVREAWDWCVEQGIVEEGTP